MLEQPIRRRSSLWATGRGAEAAVLVPPRGRPRRRPVVELLAMAFLLDTNVSLDGAAFRCWAQLMHRQSDTFYEDSMIAAIAKVDQLTGACGSGRLEQLIEGVKPPIPSDWPEAGDGCPLPSHRLLLTPFRYPPLESGSRFGMTHQRRLL